MRSHGLRVVLAATLAILLSLAGSPPSARAADPTTGTATVEVHVAGWPPLAPREQPVAGALVEVISVDTGEVLGTGTTAFPDTGIFDTFATIENLPAVAVRVRVTADGFLPAWVGGGLPNDPGPVFTLQAGQVTAMSADLYAPSGIEGHVRDTEGQPVANAVVRVYASTGTLLASVRAGADGRYEVNDLWPLSIKISASRHSFITNWANSDAQLTWSTASTIELRPGSIHSEGDSELPAPQLVLAHEAVLTGQVFGHRRPLRGAHVTVFDAATDLVLRSVTTGRSGHFRIDKLSAWGGRTVVIRVSKRGWQPSWGLSAQSRYEAQDLTLQPSQTLDLSVTTSGARYFDLAR